MQTNQINLHHPRSLGLDVHRDLIYVTELSTLEGICEQYEISTKEKEFEAFLGTLRPTDQVALEATRGSSYYVDRLSTRVASVALANPSKLQFFSKTAKNDRNDSFSLALLLSIGMLPTVWMPDRETRQDRELLHYRSSLIQEQTRLKNRLRALLAEHGISWDGADIKNACTQRFLMKLKSRLSWASREVLTNQLEQLDFLEARLKRLEPVIEVRAARWPEVALLMTIRGVNVLTAFTIMAVIGRIDRFPTADSLANYGGLVPRQYSSAGKSRQGENNQGGLQDVAMGSNGSGAESLQGRWTLPQPVQTA